jgi:ribonuclease G
VDVHTAAVAKTMLVESNAHQTRIAVLEANRLTEVFLERPDRRGVVGNVYKGRVTRVLPGMQAAFIDVGLERDAFLYVDDVGRFDGDEDEELAAGELDDEPPRSIAELLRGGQELLVQVTKDPLHAKGARVTTNVTLPSRYLVLLPNVGHVGVSRRIEDAAERARLKAILEGLEVPGCGFILRTAAEGCRRADLEGDLAYLERLWERVRLAAERAQAPALVHRDLNLAVRVVRDVFNEEFTALWVDDEGTYEEIVSFLDQFQPGLVERVRLDRHEAALFERFGIERELEAALETKVWLRSGGHLVINQTEALVAIDVNTGRFVGRENLEETALETNLEAIEEIVRQIRLRDLSGIIILDLIDMTEQEHRNRVFAALEAELRRDRARSKVLDISEFGVVELTRKRSHTNLERLLTRPCPQCQGRGRIKTPVTICLSIRRTLLEQTRRRGAAREITLRVHPDVAEALQGSERPILDEIESLGLSVVVRSDPALHPERYDLVEL